ncbi:uncharacterized protein BX663DRAFT_500205 [Cokeromyces recurvatus]|uniref:uncharacterized protein n=1 Tax=Cokeromyces recurvatus TaxID=90255 RepID=UPI00222033A2|nr:uncharacterized protein BX663DRAFT_500205 [Cokeromyces recurvatus]KAI7905578.1 hypothetical protein BX663DRAFT_500205 [Cokeromyces recurvatus]
MVIVACLIISRMVFLFFFFKSNYKYPLITGKRINIIFVFCYLLVYNRTTKSDDDFFFL